MRTRKEIEREIERAIYAKDEDGTEHKSSWHPIPIDTELLLDIREQTEEIIRTNRLIADRMLMK